MQLRIHVDHRQDQNTKERITGCDTFLSNSQWQRRLQKNPHLAKTEAEFSRSKVLVFMKP
jgi:hypothetical protein